jgi:hypothetical protein
VDSLPYTGEKILECCIGLKTFPYISTLKAKNLARGAKFFAIMTVSMTAD